MTRGAQSRAAIVQAGLKLWREGGETAVSARRIATMVNMTHAGVIYPWKNAERMRNEIARTAVALGDPGIIRHLIVSGHSAVADMSPEVRAVWLAGA